MKKLMYILGLLLLSGGFTACESEDSGIDEKKEYYWSGGEKIELDKDFSIVILGFENEEEAIDFAAGISQATLFSGKALVVVDIRDKSVEQQTALASATNRTYAHKYSGTETPFYLMGEIIMQPKTGVSPQDILSKFEVNGNIVKETDTGIVAIRLNDWNSILPTANSIHESGLVDWCHPDFWTPISM